MKFSLNGLNLAAQVQAATTAAVTAAATAAAATANLLRAELAAMTSAAASSAADAAFAATSAEVSADLARDISNIELPDGVVDVLVRDRESATYGAVITQVGRGVNARAFGAVGDGVTDDTVALQNAYNLAKSGLAIPNVYFPSDGSTYLISAPLIIDGPETGLISEVRSEYKPRIQRTTPGWIMEVPTYGCVIQGIHFVGDDSDLQNPVVDGINFDRSDGSGAATLANLDHRVLGCGFVTLKQATRAVGRNVEFFDNLFSYCTRGTVVERYGTEQCRGFVWHKNRYHSLGYLAATDPDGEGVWAIDIRSEHAFGNQVTDNMIDGQSRGFYRGPLSATVVNDNVMVKMDGVGVHILDPGTPRPGGAGWSATYNDNGTASMVTGNTFHGYFNGSRTLAELDSGPSADHFLVSDGLVENAIIEGNSIAETRKHGMYLALVNGVSIVANRVFQVGRYPGAGQDGSNVFDGIHVAAGDALLVEANVVTGTQHRYGVNANAVTQARVVGGLYDGHMTKAINATASDADIDPHYSGDINLYSRVSAAMADTMSVRAFKDSGSGERFLYGELGFATQSGTAGGEKADFVIKVAQNGVLTTVGTFANNGTFTAYNATTPQTATGWFNVRDLNARTMKLVPVSSASPSTQSLFIDASDGLLKFKDGAGTLRVVNLT